MRIWSAILGACALGLALAAAPAGANPRALLIGVGNVKGYPLPGIDVDLDNMHKVAIILGFKPEDIKTLHDSEATLENVSKAINGWVREGVRPDEHVLIYFSGHGTRMSDPKSAHGVDDALVMSDAEFAHGQIHGLLLGRELGAAIKNNPSRNVLVLVDACHSGSATRDLQLDNLSLGSSFAIKRFFMYPGMPEAPPKTRSLVVTRAADVPAGEENYAALSAAGDEETASGTAQGGMFTLGITGDIEDASRNGKHPTVDDLRLAATSYIAAHLKPADASHPVADGNQRLIRGDLALIPLRDGQGPTWQALVALAAKGQPLKVSESTGHEIYVGDQIVLKVEVPSAGYLNVVTVDSQDRATVLYPNKFNPENQVQPGTFSFPTPEMKFVVKAQDPTGPSLVVAFLTDRKVNLLDLGVDGRNAAGQMQEAFTEVNGRATRALVIESREGQIASGTFTVRVEPAKH